MGLDGVEMVLEVEEAFGIKVSDEEAVAVRTVGDLADLVAKSVGRSWPGRDICLTAATFRLIRKALIQLSPDQSKRLRPRDAVETTLPRAGRRQIWSELQTALDLRLPALVRPAWLTNVAGVLALAAGVWCGFLVSQLGAGALAGLAGVAAVVAIGLISAFITSPFAVYARPSFATIGGLTHVVLAQNYAKLSEQFKGGVPSDIWNAVRTIVVEQLGVKPEQVTRTARFVEDLGMD